VPNLAAIALLAVASVIGLARGINPAGVNNVTFAAIDAVLIGSIAAFGALQNRRLGRGLAPVVGVIEPPARELSEVA
jgi:hypothetical protein